MARSPTRPPKFCRLRPLACPILVFRCRASFVPSPSECSTLPACCFQWVSIRHRLARPSLVVEWREITSPHSGGKRPCSSARFARKSRIHESEEHTSELQSQSNLVCRLLLEKKKHTTSH